MDTKMPLPANKRVSIEQLERVPLSRDEKINYLRIALGLQNIGVNNEMADRIIETYESILMLGGNFSIKDAVNIEFAIGKKYAEQNLKNKT